VRNKWNKYFYLGQHFFLKHCMYMGMCVCELAYLKLQSAKSSPYSSQTKTALREWDRNRERDREERAEWICQKKYLNFVFLAKSCFSLSLFLPLPLALALTHSHSLHCSLCYDQRCVLRSPTHLHPFRDAPWTATLPAMPSTTATLTATATPTETVTEALHRSASRVCLLHHFIIWFFFW